MTSRVSSKNKEKKGQKEKKKKKKKKNTVQRNRKQRHRESNPVYLHVQNLANAKFMNLDWVR